MTAVLVIAVWAGLVVCCLAFVAIAKRVPR